MLEGEKQPLNPTTHNPSKENNEESVITIELSNGSQKSLPLPILPPQQAAPRDEGLFGMSYKNAVKYCVGGCCGLALTGTLALSAFALLWVILRLLSGEPISFTPSPAPHQGGP
jgi:hypothetical protein